MSPTEQITSAAALEAVFNNPENLRKVTSVRKHLEAGDKAKAQPMRTARRKRN